MIDFIIYKKKSIYKKGKNRDRKPLMRIKVDVTNYDSN